MTQDLTTIVALQFVVLIAAASAFAIFALSAARVLPAFARPMSYELRRGGPGFARPMSHELRRGRFASESAGSRWQRRAARFAALALAAGHLAIVAMAPVASPVSLAAALMLYGIAIALSVWAGRTLTQNPPALAPGAAQPERLIVHGPFRFLRQPAYSACLCAWAAGCFATFNPWFLVVAAWVAMLYVVAALLEEQRIERGVFADAYREYRRSTGLLFPRIQIEMGEAARPTFY